MTFVENMDDRVVDKEETKDKKDYPPLSFVEYAHCLFHDLTFFLNAQQFDLSLLINLIGKSIKYKVAILGKYKSES